MEDLERLVGSKAADKFEQVGLTTTSGRQLITGSPAWFAWNSRRGAWVGAKSHDLLIGRVVEPGPADSDRRPLLFHEGRCASLVNEPGLLTSTGPATWF